MASRRNKHRGTQSNRVLYLGDEELDQFLRWDELIVDVET